MVHLTAQDAVSPSVLMVSAEMGLRDLNLNHKLQSYEAYAVFSEVVNQKPSEQFLGIVPKHMIGRYPYRIFGDLLSCSTSPHVEPSTPLDVLYADFQRHRIDAFSVIDSGQRFIGAITPTSLLETLWHREQFLTMRLQKEINEKNFAKRELQQAKDELDNHVGARNNLVFDHTQQLLELSESLISTETRERRALAGELHDHLAQMLAVGRIKLAQGSHLTSDPEVLSLLNTVDQFLQESLSYTRTLMTELNSFNLHQSGLLKVLEELTKKMKLLGLVVTLEAERPLPDLSENQEFLLYWSLRELLFNVIKHAHVDQATISIHQLHGTHLHCMVSDHGCGFDPATMAGEIPGQDHFGLSGIRGRMTALHGTISLNSYPGQGTRASLTIPLSPPSPPH
ncbi:histidine kinase [Nitrospira sp. MA-1]|nr:histidine kinase [Nitrospira sp. MA-1]